MEEKKTDLMEEDVIDIREYIKLLWRRKWFILSVVVVSFLTTLVSLLFQPKVFEVESVIELGMVSGKYTISKDKLQTLITSTDVFKTALEKEGKWREGMDVTVEGVGKGDFIKLKVQGGHPEDMKSFCLDLSKAVVGYGNEKIEKKVLIYKKHFEELNLQKDSVNKEIDQIKNLLAEEGERKEVKEQILFRGILLRNILSYYRQLLTQLEQKEVNLKLLLGDVREFRIIKVPEVPKKPVHPRYKLSLAISIFVGGFLGVFLTFLLEFLKKIDWRT